MGDRDGPTVTCGDSDIWNAEKIDLWQAARDDAFQDEQLGTKEKFWVGPNSAHADKRHDNVDTIG